MKKIVLLGTSFATAGSDMVQGENGLLEVTLAGRRETRNIRDSPCDSTRASGGCDLALCAVDRDILAWHQRAIYYRI